MSSQIISKYFLFWNIWFEIGYFSFQKIMHIYVEESQNCFLPYNPCQCVYLYSTSNMALLQKFIKEMRRPL